MLHKLLAVDTLIIADVSVIAPVFILPNTLKSDIIKFLAAPMV